MNEILQKLTADLAELVSRGVNHPAADQLIGGMKVALQQATDMAGTPAPPADPIQTQLDGIAERLEKLQVTFEAFAK